MKIGVFLKRLAQLSTWLSALALIVMLLVSVADVAMANLLNRPIVGAFDLVETTLVVVVFLGFPAAFLSEGHIAVDVIDFFVSPTSVARLKLLAKVVTFVFLAFLAWQMVTPAYDAFRFGERKQELGLPLFVLWIPMVFGIGVSALMVLFSLRQEDRASSTGEA